MLKAFQLSLLTCLLLVGCQFSISEVPVDAQLPLNTPSLPDAPPPTLEPDIDLDKPVDTYIDGIIVEIASTHFVITTSLSNLYTVQLSPQSNIESARDAVEQILMIGDYVEITGQVDHTERTVEADEVWVNLIRVSGTLTNVQVLDSVIQFQVQDIRQGTFLVIIEQNTRIALDDVDTFELGEIPWEAVKFVDVSGFKQEDETIRAINVFFSRN